MGTHFRRPLPAHPCPRPDRQLQSYDRAPVPPLPAACSEIGAGSELSWARAHVLVGEPRLMEITPLFAKPGP
jgi:hypothetical protein